MGDRYREGINKRREILGEDYVDQAQESTTAFDVDFQDFITRYAWGEVWERGVLDIRERHLITLAILCVLGTHEELSMHLKATHNTGVTRADVREIFHQVAVYAGLPAANAGFSIAKKIFAEDE